MKLINVSADDIICKCGDTAESMYFIKAGLFGVYAEYGKRGRTLLSVLGKGKCFGEMGVIEKAPRSADIVALEKGELLEIGVDDFEGFVKENPADVVTIMQGLGERLARTNADLERAARTVGRFMETNGEIKTPASGKLQAIADYARRHFGLFGRETAPKTAYAAGEVVFRQGDVGTNMFRILSGEVSVISDYGKLGETVLAELGKGEIFGEMAVINEERRSATVVAKTDITVETVVNVKLKSFLASHPADALTILHNMSSKLRATTEKYIGTLSAISEFVAAEKGHLGEYVGGDDFITYSECYNEMMLTSPAVTYTSFTFPDFF